MVRGKPLVATETGYHTAVNMPVGQAQPGVSEAAMAKYVPRLFMEYFNAGVPHTFGYELLDEWPDPQKDESEKNFGLLRNDYSYKPAATALKNTISLLRDPGAEFTPGALDYTITGGNRDLHHSLLQKSNGDFFLALWQEVSSYDASNRRDIAIADQPITLTLNTPISGAATYLPNDSLLPTASYGALIQLDLEVPDRLLLVRLTPVPEPGVAGLLGLGVAMLLMRRRRQRSHSSLGRRLPCRAEA